MPNAKAKPITKARKLENTKKPMNIIFSCFPRFVFLGWPLGVVFKYPSGIALTVTLFMIQVPE